MLVNRLPWTARSWTGRGWLGWTEEAGVRQSVASSVRGIGFQASWDVPGYELQGVLRLRWLEDPEFANLWVY